MRHSPSSAGARGQNSRMSSVNSPSGEASQLGICATAGGVDWMMMSRDPSGLRRQVAAVAKSTAAIAGGSRRVRGQPPEPFPPAGRRGLENGCGSARRRRARGRPRPGCRQRPAHPRGPARPSRRTPRRRGSARPLPPARRRVPRSATRSCRPPVNCAAAAGSRRLHLGQAAGQGHLELPRPFRGFGRAAELASQRVDGQAKALLIVDRGSVEDVAEAVEIVGRGHVEHLLDAGRGGRFSRAAGPSRPNIGAWRGSASRWMSATHWRLAIPSASARSAAEWACRRLTAQTPSLGARRAVSRPGTSPRQWGPASARSTPTSSRVRDPTLANGSPAGSRSASR